MTGPDERAAWAALQRIPGLKAAWDDWRRALAIAAGEIHHGRVPDAERVTKAAARVLAFEDGQDEG